MAEFCSVGDTVDAAPDDFLSAVNIPSHTLIRAAAFPAIQPFGKGVLAVVPPALLFASVRAGLAVAAGDFSLHLAVHLLSDDAYDNNLLVTEGSPVVNGKFDVCAYYIDFDNDTATEISLRTPYNNRPVYVYATVGDKLYVATDYKTYTVKQSFQDGGSENYEYIAYEYAFISKKDYVNSNDAGYEMVEDMFD